MSLKIAVWHNLPTGGGKRALHMHVKGLHARGHRLHIYSTEAAAHHYLPLAPFAESETILPVPPAPPPKRSLARRLVPKGFRSEQAEARIAMVQQIKLVCQQSSSLINADGCDVLFANSTVNTYASPIGDYVDSPSIVYLGEPNRTFYEALPRLPWLLPPVGTMYPRNILKRVMEQSRDLHQNHAYRYQATEELSSIKSYDRILCNSRFSRESILRAYCLDSTVCYLGINANEFKPTGKPKSNFVIGTGSINFTKRIDAAIMAVAEIPAAMRPKLLWIGNFSDDCYRSHICHLAHEAQVEFENRILVSDEELQAAMAEAACFLYTSHLEPFGLAPLEANACGTAVVAIAEGGVRETIVPGVNGWLSANNNPSELAELIMKFTTNLKHAEMFGAQAREYATQNWGVNDAIDRLEQHLLDTTR